MGFETGQPIEVYVELAGKEKYHSSLKGRDEENQHPISAITNLQDNLDNLQERINTGTESLNQEIDNLDNKLDTNLENIDNRFGQFELDLNELNTSLNAQIEHTTSELRTETNTKVQEVRDFVVEELSHIDLDAYYTIDETEERLDGMFRYKGQVPDFESLPVIQNEKGDVYNVQRTGANYVWTGFAWDNLSPTICLKGYATKDYVNGTLEASIKLLKDHLEITYYTKSEIDELIDSIIHIGPEILSCVFIFKGHVETKADLPETGNKVGDVYVILEDKSKWFWAGASWTLLAEDLTDKVYTKQEIDAIINVLNDRIDDIVVSTVTRSEFDEVSDTVEELSDHVADIQEDLDKLNETKIWHEIGQD